MLIVVLLGTSSPLETVNGLQWGNYCGSPCHPSPVVQWIQTCPFPANKIIASAHNLSAYLCGKNVCILSKRNLSNVSSQIGMLTWGYNDMLFRIHSLNSNSKTVFNPMRPDIVTCCEYVPGVEILFIGGTSGVLNVWPVRFSMDGVRILSVFFF